jgi:hypothetical protein
VCHLPDPLVMSVRAFSCQSMPFDGVIRYYFLIACRGDLQQRELLQRFHAEGLDCEPKLG